MREEFHPMSITEPAAKPQKLFLPGVVERPNPLAESGLGLQLPTNFRSTPAVAIDEPVVTDPAARVEPTLAVQEAPPAAISVTDLTGDAEPAVADKVSATPTKGLRKPFTLVDPNQSWVMWVGVILLGGILLASLVASFNSVYDMARWIGMPPSIQWLPVIILDVAIVGFSWALMVFSTRAADQTIGTKKLGEAREKTFRTRSYLFIVTGMSVVANFMHTFDYWLGDLSTPQAIVGVVYSASIPLWALAAVEELIRMVFARRQKIYQDAVA
jgi:hypothetical protein